MENNIEDNIISETKKIFLVDYENVKVSGLNGIKNLLENDELHIFYSDKSDSLTFGLHRRIMEAKVQIFYNKVQVGYKNALDFQLSSFLGYIICQNKYECNNNVLYYIVSKDLGFLRLSSYWSKKGIDIRVVSDVTTKVEILDESSS